MSEIPKCFHFLGRGEGRGLKQIASIYQTMGIRLLNRETEKEEVYDILELLFKLCIYPNIHGYQAWHKNP